MTYVRNTITCCYTNEKAYIYKKNTRSGKISALFAENSASKKTHLFQDSAFLRHCVRLNAQKTPWIEHCTIYTHIYRYDTEKRNSLPQLALLSYRGKRQIIATHGCVQLRS